MTIAKQSKYKSWNNLKKQIESFLCASLKSKISFFYTSYHGVKNEYGRATINYCKKEMIAFSWAETFTQKQNISEEYNKIKIESFTSIDSEKNEGKYETLNNILIKEKWMPNGILSEVNFINALTIYLKTDIKTSLHSDNYLLRTLAYLDRRVGKRTLIKIKDEVEKLPEWVKQFYILRCQAENIC